MAQLPDKPPEINLLPGREPRAVDTGVGSSVTFSGLVLHYPCDDLTTTDTSGNSNTGTLFGSGNALSTGLINNKITLSSSGGIQFTTVSGLGLATVTTAMSISCWIKTTTLDCTIVSMRNTGGANTLLDFVLGYNGVSNLNTGKLSILLRADNGSGLNSINGATALNDGNWHHVVWTRTTGQVNTLYVDNVSAGTVTDTMTGALTPNVAGSAIGYEIIAGGRPLTGSIDDYQVYNRALTTTEINSIYTAGNAAPAGYTMPAATGNFGTIGVAASTVYGRTLQQTTVGTFTLTGIAAGSLQTYIMPAAIGSFAFTGVPANLVYTSLNFYTMPADTGAFTFTGIAASLVYQTIGGYTLAATTGVFTTTGIAANTLYGRTLQQTTVGAFVITGVAAGSISSYVMPALPGAFVFTATAAGTLYGRTLQQTTVGTFVFTGLDAGMIYTVAGNAYVMTASPTLFVFTGIDANLVYKPLVNYVLVCGTGQFYFVGYSVGSPGQGLGISGGLGTPVVTVLFGGAPVIDVTYLGPKAGTPVSEAAPGEGIPVTKVLTGGTPVVYI